MMGKEHCQFIGLLFTCLVTSTFFTSGSAADNNTGGVRRKRNIICFLGLSGLLSDVCYEALKALHKYDPVPIGELMGGKLQNGEFKGLSTLRNDSNINIECHDDLVVLDTVLDISDASINYEWRQKVLMTFKGSVWTKVKHIKLALELTLNMTGGIDLDVTNLKVLKMEGMKFGFSGLGPLNPVIKVLGNLVIHMWDHKIVETIEDLLRKTLDFSQFKVTF